MGYIEALRDSLPGLEVLLLLLLEPAPDTLESSLVADGAADLKGFSAPSAPLTSSSSTAAFAATERRLAGEVMRRLARSVLAFFREYFRVEMVRHHGLLRMTTTYIQL
jgi:hypothetical protein